MFYHRNKICIRLMPKQSIWSRQNGKCIDSVTINRNNLNISINAIMLLSTYEPTQSTHNNISNDSIKSINQLNILLTFFGITFDSYQSLKVNRRNHLLFENELTQSPINSLGKGTESILSIFQKKMNRFKSINSIELIGIQVWLQDFQ